MDRCQLRTYESGAHKSNNGVYYESNVLGISISNDGVVKFLKNGVDFRTCGKTLEFPVHLDMSFHDSGANKAQVQFIGMKNEPPIPTTPSPTEPLNPIKEWRTISEGMKYDPKTGIMLKES